MSARGKLLVCVSAASAAGIAVVCVLTRKVEYDSDLPPLGLFKRPTGIVGIQLPFVAWKLAIARYAEEALATEDQKRLLREGVIDPKYFHFSQL
jgi:hypothetical protein